jgi:hypothetical protein
MYLIPFIKATFPIGCGRVDQREARRLEKQTSIDFKTYVKMIPIMLVWFDLRLNGGLHLKGDTFCHILTESRQTLCAVSELLKALIPVGNIVFKNRLACLASFRKRSIFCELRPCGFSN